LRLRVSIQHFSGEAPKTIHLVAWFYWCLNRKEWDGAEFGRNKAGKSADQRCSRSSLIGLKPLFYGLNGLIDFNHSTIWPWDGAFDQEDVQVFIDVDDFETLDGDAAVSVLSGHLLVLEDPRR
jgi:hypothetical protein